MNWQRDFKTSYVEVYRFSNQLRSRLIHISKHLMLKFISIIPIYYQHFCDFKTSYVEVYRLHLILETELFKHFKTSYVEVYPVFKGSKNTKVRFQNILCWSLSKMVHMEISELRNFKTSYVEVYPTFSRYFYLLLSIFPFIFPDFYHFYQASAHILFPIQYLTNSPTLQYFLNIFLFFAW